MVLDMRIRDLCLFGVRLWVRACVLRRGTCTFVRVLVYGNAYQSMYKKGMREVEKFKQRGRDKRTHSEEGK